MAYAGQRSVTQFLAIAPATQANPRHGGGVVDFDRNYHGVHGSLRFAWEQVDLLAGVAVERMVDARRGHENFIGPAATPTALGVVDALRRDERNTALSREAFVQAAVQWNDRLQTQAGLRSGSTRLSAQDAFLSNGDDSGVLRLHYTNPVAGLTWKLSPRWNLHASAARGYESPTLGELAYRPDGSGGLNTTLRPQTSRQLEIGSKWRGQAMDLEATLFRIGTDDEFGIQSNAGGRQSFQNVGRTQRTVAELAAAWRMHPAWRSSLALTWLAAEYRDAFLACAGIPCAAPTVPVNAGNRIAGTQRTSAFGELAWRGAGDAPLEAAVEWRGGERCQRPFLRAGRTAQPAAGGAAGEGGLVGSWRAKLSRRRAASRRVASVLRCRVSTIRLRAWPRSWPRGRPGSGRWPVRSHWAGASRRRRRWWWRHTGCRRRSHPGSSGAPRSTARPR